MVVWGKGFLIRFGLVVEEVVYYGGRGGVVDLVEWEGVVFGIISVEGVYRGGRGGSGLGILISCGDMVVVRGIWVIMDGEIGG